MASSYEIRVTCNVNRHAGHQYNLTGQTKFNKSGSGTANILAVSDHFISVSSRVDNHRTIIKINSIENTQTGLQSKEHVVLHAWVAVGEGVRYLLYC